MTHVKEWDSVVTCHAGLNTARTWNLSTYAVGKHHHHTHTHTHTYMYMLMIYVFLSPDTTSCSSIYTITYVLLVPYFTGTTWPCTHQYISQTTPILVPTICGGPKLPSTQPQDNDDDDNGRRMPKVIRMTKMNVRDSLYSPSHDGVTLRCGWKPQVHDHTHYTIV